MSAKKRTAELHKAVIVKSPIEDLTNPKEALHINYISNNGSDVLSSTENLPTIAACHKNIVAHTRAAHGKYYIVHDMRNEEKVKRYKLFSDGSKSPL